jgi:hypothetical protein
MSRARFSGWGWSRNDAADYARLAVALQGPMRPVRPADKPVPHIRGQLALWAEAPWVGPVLAGEQAGGADR